MNIEKTDLISLITKIREEIGHKPVEINIQDIFFDENSGNLLIITPDRPEKSVVIGKGGWVVGRLREELKINSIHVEAYSDFLVPQYRMELALDKLEKIIPEYKLPEKRALINLSHFLQARINNPYDIDFLLNKLNHIPPEEDQFKTVVALSGGVDSSASLIIAKMLGFNPVAVTVNPGNIILPSYFRETAENLTRKLGVEHQYLKVDMEEVIEGSLKGRFHPCGRCSKIIEDAVFAFAKDNNIPFMVYGDLLSTGTQSLQLEIGSHEAVSNITKEDVLNAEEGVLRINLPALLSLKKGEVKNIAARLGVGKKGGYGCPLLVEVHKKHPHMRRFSIQRILRETRAGMLEPGEALDQITGFF